MLLMLFFCSRTAFGRPALQPVIFTLIPIIIWAAFRFGRHGVTAATLIISAAAIWGTATGSGPFARHELDAALKLLHAFVTVITLTGLVLAATLAERRRAEQALRSAYEEVEAEVTRRTEALKAAQMELIQAAKMESVGRLAAGVAHEVKNPLAVILSGLDYLAGRLAAADREGAGILEDMRAAVRKADVVVRGLLDFSVMRDLEIQPESLNRVIEESLRLVKHELDKGHVQLVQELDPDLPRVPLDRQKVEQVFVNVLLNAVQAMPSGGKLTVRTRRADGAVAAEVDDTGPGIPEEKLSRVFDPFFTTKPVGQGTGLGLTVVRRIVELHGGEITLSNRPGGGARATLIFPMPRCG